ncbi:hypothetical protein ACGFNU_26860 [Spirillospora sp. NPDC048911]|uniref:hypothetical protein n=1 Tax=Spirillospora sp. NPDC048911 TaxID=3364527 RepID=UPI0037129020
MDGSVPDEVNAFFADGTAYDHLVLALSGGAGAGPFPTLDLAELRGGFEAKFWLHLGILQAALPRLAADGSITFITASSARAALPGTAGLAAINGALEAVAQAVLLAATNGFMTGNVIEVNGGLSLATGRRTTRSAH